MTIEDNSVQNSIAVLSELHDRQDNMKMIMKESSNEIYQGALNNFNTAENVINTDIQLAILRELILMRKELGR